MKRKDMTDVFETSGTSKRQVFIGLAVAIMNESIFRVNIYSSCMCLINHPLSF